MYNSSFHLENSSDYGDFQRSHSARLRSKTPTRPITIEEMKKQEQRDESMRRLLEWKQRMLQSPLSRKGSRAQTPVGNHSSTNTAEFSPKMPHYSQRVSRKSSTASRTSRTRSLSRLSNGMSSTSSSDEGRII